MVDISEQFVRATQCGKRRPKQTFSEGIGFTPILLGFPQIKSRERDTEKPDTSLSGVPERGDTENSKEP